MGIGKYGTNWIPASRPDGGAVDLREQTIPDRSEHPEFLEDKDAAIYPRLSIVPAPTEKPIDIPSLQLKLSSLLRGDPQLERRARKLAWHLSKGRRLTCGWDSICLSELTPAESRMPDDEFLALYTDQVQTPNRKGGRPRKYRTATAQRKAHAERQRQYRERKLAVISDVTKTPSQVTEN